MPALTNFRLVVALMTLGAALAVGGSIAAAAPPVTGAHSITLAAHPATITYLGTTRLTGTFSGAETGGQKVTLESTDFPFTAPFNRTATTTTNATDGSFAFTVAPFAATRYRVTGKTKHSPQTVSPVVTLKVRYKLTLHVSDRTPKAGQRVRFSGLVYPAHDGRKVAIQRKTPSDSWKTVKATTLVQRVGSPPQSAYRTSLRVRRSGRYRVSIASDADHVRNHTSARRLRVHG
jgi:hypothetical protein